MSNQITQAFVRQYRTDVEHLLQTDGSVLRPYVMWGTYTGEGGRPVNQIGAVTAQKVTTRHGDTPYADTPHASRWVEPQDYEVPADLIDTEDKLRILIDPAGPYQKSHAMALGRSIDQEILDNIFATSKTGPQGGSSEPWNSAYTIAAGGKSLTVAKMKEALRLLMAARNRRTDRRIMVISSQEHDALLNEPQVINGDYSKEMVLESGMIKRFLGFDIEVLEELQDDGTDRSIPVWVPSGVHCGMWNDVKSYIDPMPTKRYATQVYSKATFGATRTQIGKIVEIKCALVPA